MPRFDTAVVPPWYSSSLSFFTRARAAISFISFEMTDSVFVSAERITGVIKPPGIDTATPTSEWVWCSMVFSVHDTLASGTRFSAKAKALMMKSLTETL